MDKKNIKFLLWGAGAGFILLFLFFFILVLINSFPHAISQFRQIWYWILILAAGFGLQVGLYVFIREKIRIAGRVLAASGGISIASMVVCCLHHLTVLLPIMGLAATSLFLVKYQIFFLVIGVLSNIIGIVLMLEIIQKRSLYQGGGVLNYLAKINFRNFKKITIAGAAAALFISFLGIKNRAENKMVQNFIAASENNNQKTADFERKISLPRKSSEAGGLSIDAAPIDFSFGEPVQFEIAFNTHQGNLDFDVTKKSILVDNLGNIYSPLNWRGGQGGHHLSGTLIFPPLKRGIKQINLIIKDIFADERIFEWKLD